MAINVLAPFVLTRKLLPCLVRGNDARIITTSSISQSRTLPDIDSLFARMLPGGKYDHEPLPYSAHSFYSYSKVMLRISGLRYLLNERHYVQLTCSANTSVL